MTLQRIFRILLKSILLLPIWPFYAIGAWCVGLLIITIQWVSEDPSYTPRKALRHTIEIAFTDIWKWYIR